MAEDIKSALHDASPSWNGFNYQGKVGLYVCLTLILQKLEEVELDSVELIDWRGIEPFGYGRKWNELAYEEALGLAKFALEKDALDPVDVMCQEFNLKRRHETTLKQFNQWVSEYKNRS